MRKVWGHGQTKDWVRIWIPRAILPGLSGRFSPDQQVAAALWNWAQLDERERGRYTLDYLKEYDVKAKLYVEQLEQREVPTVTANLVAGNLVLRGDAADDTVNVSVIGGHVVVTEDGLTTASFSQADVTSLTVFSGRGDDDVTTTVPVKTFIDLGPGRDKANDFSRQGTIVGGDGDDQLYAILGANFIDGRRGRDRVITNATSVNVADPRDEIPVVFGQSQDTFALIDRVLYYTPVDGDNRVVLTQDGDDLVATSSTAMFRAPRSSVRTFATVFGPGNDVLVNQVNGLTVVAYGSGGNDVLLFGRARFAFGKGGGGNDVLDASRALAGDLAGDPGVDVLLLTRGTQRGGLGDIMVGGTRFAPQGV